MKTILWVMLLLTILSACTSAPVISPATEPVKPVFGRSSIVTMGTPNLDRTKPSTFSWLDDVDVIGRPGDLPDTNIQKLVQRIIQNRIINKGYWVMSANGDFQLHATLVLASDIDKKTLLHETGGIDPGLAGDQTANKGSLVLELRQGRTLRWRGAIQIYILPDYDPEMVAQRIDYAVSQLLQTWP